MKVLITGSKGFIGSNLAVHLREQPHYEVLEFNRGDDLDTLSKKVAVADAIVHLAGVNRPENNKEFMEVNAGLTSNICELVATHSRKIPIIFSSSIQCSSENPYGRSKQEAEQVLTEYANSENGSVVIYRLPNVFGKWCRPNYNSVVATFCHNIINEQPIRIDDPSTRLRLVYIDDVVESILTSLENSKSGLVYENVSVVYQITLAELAETIQAFRGSRDSLIIGRVGSGLTRALYSTYVSYLSAEQFSYPLPVHGDDRGVFVEMLKTQDSGQFSFFTAKPGVTRGEHYHHTKTEKFLVIKGEARFKFRQIVSGDCVEITVSSHKPTVVETIPGWIHHITNTGNEEMIVMLWANEVFDRSRPDTISAKV